MNENIFELLMYLFENYMDDSEDETETSSDVIRTELLEAGFKQIEVNKAFNWLESLSDEFVISPIASSSFRVFSPQEIIKLDIECQNLLIYLEHHGILSPHNREIILDKLMALGDEQMSLEKLKWLILMVLFNQPDEELAISHMEDMVYDMRPLYLN